MQLLQLEKSRQQQILSCFLALGYHLIRSRFLLIHIHKPILVKDITVEISALILGKAG
jgi:hypothetical protein